VGWCKRWLDFVSQNLGVKPLIYLNQSTAEGYDWQPVIDSGYGLWIAAYTYDPTNNNFKTGKWPFAAMQQWTDKQIVPGANGELDGDVFFGDSKAFGAYGYHKPVEVVTPPVEIPIEVTTSSDSGTQAPATSANSSGISEETANPIKPKPLPEHVKPSMDFVSTIVWILKNTKGTLKNIWIFIFGK
jgi:hypothetical protein